LAKNPYLIASVARDYNVKRIKGQRAVNSQAERMLALKKTKLVDKVVLGGLKNHLPHILKQAPQIIALGYDQESYTKNLDQNLNKRGLKVEITRLKPFHPSKYKSSLMKI
jgi:glycerol-3-phosphate cytidylyltransferase-like family protein